MYKTFSADVFRGLRNIELERLARVNIITGLNATGKSSLLEAIQVHAKPNDIGSVLQLDAQRIGAAIGVLPPIDFMSVPWRTLFGGYSTTTKLTLRGELHQRAWNVELSSERDLDTKAFDPAGLAQLQVFLQQSPVGLFRIKCSSGIDHWDSIAIAYVNGAINFFNVQAPHHSAVPNVKCFRMPASLQLNLSNSSSLAAQYSRLVERGGEELLIDALRAVDPRIKRLTVWTNGAASRLHADIGNGRILDLALISDGLSRIAGITLGIADSQDGVFLLDEFENGIHVSALEATWRAVDLASKTFNAQLFVTTHSQECAKAALQAMSDRKSLLLHRLDLVDNETRVSTYDWDMLDAAFNAALEVR